LFGRSKYSTMHTPNNNVISATLMLFSCWFFTTQHSVPYNNVGLPAARGVRTRKLQQQQQQPSLIPLSREPSAKEMWGSLYLPIIILKHLNILKNPSILLQQKGPQNCELGTFPQNLNHFLSKPYKFYLQKSLQVVRTNPI